MAQIAVPPVGDLVSGLPLPPTQRVAHHDQVADAELSRTRSNRWLRPAADITASLLALVIATRGGAAVQLEVLAAVALAWPLFLAGNGWFNAMAELATPSASCAKYAHEPAACSTRRAKAHNGEVLMPRLGEHARILTTLAPV